MIILAGECDSLAIWKTYQLLYGVHLGTLAYSNMWEQVKSQKLVNIVKMVVTLPESPWAQGIKSVT